MLMLQLRNLGMLCQLEKGRRVNHKVTGAWSMSMSASVDDALAGT